MRSSRAIALISTLALLGCGSSATSILLDMTLDAPAPVNALSVWARLLGATPQVRTSALPADGGATTLPGQLRLLLPDVSGTAQVIVRAEVGACALQSELDVSFSAHAETDATVAPPSATRRAAVTAPRTATRATSTVAAAAALVPPIDAARRRRIVRAACA
jgi:hypothetical protein